jgi:hypothetical protein
VNPLIRECDIFLSHAYVDKALVEIAGAELEACGYNVFLDWREATLADRSKVNHKTAEILRKQISNSSSLFYAVSSNSPNSRWMPWELGYGDARTGRVFIFPLDDGAAEFARGQEYLRLYPIADRKRLRAFLAANVPKAKNRFIGAGDNEMTAVVSDRISYKLSEALLDPVASYHLYNQMAKAWLAMFGIGRS